MKPFEYAAPNNLRDATGMLQDTWGKTEVLAGGTDLITCLKQNLTQPERVVSLKNIAELKGVQQSGNAVRIGAMTTLADLAADGAIREHFPSLITAAEGVGSAQMMSMGTVGGDLCQRPRCWYYRNGLGLIPKQEGKSLVREGDNRYHAIFGNEGDALFVSPSGLAPALIALGAAFVIAGQGGQTHKVPAAQFFQTPANGNQRETVLKPNEILAHIEVPLAGWKNASYEVRHRHGLDWPYVSAAVAFPRQGGAPGRVVLGYVAPVPWVAQAAGEALNSGNIDEMLASQCGEAAARGAKPLSNNAYKVQLVKTAVKRAVLAATKA